jgi:guanylate kinase
VSQSQASQAILLVVSGPGGAGKSTLCERLAAEGDDLDLSISATSRAPRGEERDEVHYFFTTREKFEADAEAGRFAEHAEVAGEFYGTPRDFLDARLAAGTDVVLDIDVQGAEQVRGVYGRRAVLVFVLPPSRAALEGRLRARGTDSEERIAERMALAEREIEAAGALGYDYLVINDILEDALAELAAIRRAERSGIPREGSRAAWDLKTWT